MRLNSAACPKYLFWNVSLCKSTKGVGLRERLATATCHSLHAEWVQHRARGSDGCKSPPQEMLQVYGALAQTGSQRPGWPKDYRQMRRSFSGKSSLWWFRNNWMVSVKTETMMVEKPGSKMKPHCDQWNWYTRTFFFFKDIILLEF